MRSSARLKSISLLKESISHLNLESKAGARLDRKCANVGEGRHREASTRLRERVLPLPVTPL